MHDKLLEQIQKYPAFIFDMDGTIINSEIWHHVAWKHMVKLFGGPELPHELLLEYGGLPTATICRDLIKRYNLNADPEEMAKTKTDLFINEYMPKAEPFWKIENILKYLYAQGKRIAIATSSHQPEARYLLGKVGLMPYIHSLVTGDMVQKGKPNPDIYLLAAKSLGADPVDCLVFEDTVVGMIGIKNAKMDGVKVFDGEFDCDHIIKADEAWEARDTGLSIPIKMDQNATRRLASHKQASC